MSVETANNTMAANVAGAAGTANDAGRAGTVFRFKFHPDINAMLQRFAGVHHGDDLEEFKDSWETLLARYRTAIDIEIQRLQEIGFTGDVENKMFVSVRYYYCKQFKIGGENNTDDREEQAIVQNGTADAGAAAAGADAAGEADVGKRAYVKINKDVHEAIERFLAKDNNHALKPAIAWNNFSTEYGEDFCPKKTFKNRIYNYREKQRNETVPVEQPQQDRIDVPDNGFGIGTTFDV